MRRTEDLLHLRARDPALDPAGPRQPHFMHITSRIVPCTSIIFGGECPAI
jgi:hypothetical protein